MDDEESVLIAECVAAFAKARLDRWGDRRVLEYLAQRYGPIAYEGVEEEAGQSEEGAG